MCNTVHIYIYSKNPPGWCRHISWGNKNSWNFFYINNVIVCAFGSSNEMNIINNHLCFVQELSLLVEEQERDGEGAASVMPLAQSSSVRVRFN